MFACGGEFDIGHDSDVVVGAIAMIRRRQKGNEIFQGPMGTTIKLLLPRNHLYQDRLNLGPL